jgi:hypothetical protein
MRKIEKTPLRPSAPKAGGTYAQGDFSRAAQRSKLRQTKAGEPEVPTKHGRQPNTT